MRVVLAGTAGAVILGLCLRGLDVGPVAGAVSALFLAAFILPAGLLLTERTAPSLSAGERWLLAALVGYPVSAAVYQLLARAGLEGAALLLFPAALLIAGWRQRRRPPAPVLVPADRWLAGTALLLVPSLLWLGTREGGAFRPLADGSLEYRHSVDHAVHLALYWEMVRGLPPEQLPTAAGMPFPSYHTLSFVPGVLLARHGGVEVTTVYHAVSPLLRLGLLFAGAYLIVRFRSDDRRLGLAALLVLGVIAPWVEESLGERLVATVSPYYFFSRNESGGGGVVVWAAVAALLALYQRHGERSALILAGTLAGVAFGFKAQMFLLFGPALFLVLAWTAWRRRETAAGAGLILGLAAFGLCFLASRGHGPLGTLQITPGLFARLYVYPRLGTFGEALQSLPYEAGALVAAPLAVWRLATFSPMVVAVFGRPRAMASRPLDFFFAAALLAALPLAFAFSAVSIDRIVSPFEFLQAAHGLAFAGALAAVIGGGALVARRGGSSGAALAGVLALAVLLGALTASKPAYVPPREAVVLDSDEVCALSFLREHTPLDAVTVGWRARSAEGGGWPKGFNHQALLGGIAGRRTVLEYYDEAVDPRTRRERAIKRLFETTDAAVGEEILERYAVDYVMEFPERPLRFDSGGLWPVYARRAVRVLERQKETGSARRRPPRAWAEPRNDCDASP